MPKKTSTIKPVILRRAIACFGDSGLAGVTTRDLATAAGVTESSIYRLFVSKENLYEEAIRCASKQARAAVDGPATQLAEMLGRWFDVLSRADARMIQQVLKKVHSADRKLLEQASSAIAETVAAVAALIRGSGAFNQDSKAVSGNAQIMVMALFNLKVLQDDEQPSAGERQKIDALIESWIEAIKPEGAL